MYCNKCGTLNDNDSLFCKKCGNNLIEDYLDNKKESKEKKVINKEKTVNKKTVKNINKVKNVKKGKEKKEKVKKQKNNDKVIIVKKMSGFQKLMFTMLILVIFVLIGIIGMFGLFTAYKYTKEVPDVVGMTYEEAKNKLESLDFVVSKKEIEGKENIVLKQNKKNGIRAINGSNIVLYVGTVNDTLPNLVGMSKDAAISIIEKYNIKYEINIVVGNKEGVLSQNYKKGTKIKDIKLLKLKVGVIEKEDSEVKEKNEEEKEDALEFENGDE